MRNNKPLNFLHEKGLILKAKPEQLELIRFPIDKIMKIFGKNSLEDVMNALKEDSSEWSQRVYEKIQKRDSLASHLTFQIIKQAKNKEWV